jgi:nucleoside-diphosphate-sugar epimerase
MRASPELSRRVNLLGTAHVLCAAHAVTCERYAQNKPSAAPSPAASEPSAVRVLFASTCCIYGNNNCHPSDEESPTAPTEGMRLLL